MMKVIKGALKEHDIHIENWDEPCIRNFNGKKVQGRHTKGYGTSVFNYAGKTYEPEPWTTSMKIIKMDTELLVHKETKKAVRFNFCLCGLYETGETSIPHHSDTIPTREDLVVGISFGAPRILEWREYNQEIKKKTDSSKIHLHGFHLRYETKRYLLEHGDVYIFDGHSQINSTHSIPSIENVGERINLTFRTGL